MTAGHVLPLDAKSEELLAEFNAEVREELALVAKRTLARKGLRQTVEAVGVCHPGGAKRGRHTYKVER